MVGVHKGPSKTSLSFLYLGLLYFYPFEVMFHITLIAVRVFKTGWPSGLRRWIKAPISSGAWVRIPLQSIFFDFAKLRRTVAP